MSFETYLIRAGFAISLYLSAGAWPPTAGAQPVAGRDAALDAAMAPLFATQEFTQVAISPDGQRVAWVLSIRSAGGARTSSSAIYEEDLAAGAKPHQISAALDLRHAEHDIAWSPDSKHLAFLSDADEPGQLQLYVADVTRHPVAGRVQGVRVEVNGRPRRLTDLKGSLGDPKWSPDGARIAFLFIENAPRVPGPLEPMTPLSGEIEEHPLEQRLAIVDLSSGHLRQVSPPDLYVYEYDWRSDGRAFVATAAHGNGDANWWIAEIYTIDAVTGEGRSIYKPALQITEPHWSPDGRSVAFIEGLMSDAGFNGGDVYVVPGSGGEARDVTPDMKASASWLRWLASGRIVFTENVDGESGVAAVDPAGGGMETLWHGPEVIASEGALTSLSLTPDGKSSAVVRNSFSSPPEVWTGPVGSWRQITHDNAAVRPTWGEAKSLHWTSDGFQVQGWLLYPRDYDPARRYPVVVTVHGGPSGAARAGWPDIFFNTDVLSSLGYFVLYPNPRGSFGQGEKFTQANVKDFGYGDLRDIMAGLDEVTKTLPVDPSRAGITGWSYGGYMTMWAITQTHRFKAAVAGAGLANWLSYYGENDIDQWMIPFFGASVYDDPAVYARSSPISYIKSAKTPTLVLVGDRDGECPAPQSFEFWHALNALGVPTKLVVYPNEGHLIHSPEHRRDIVQRMVAWFDQYLH
jgi:dipeptidyl aminopeptidase/acylaminoacyl peptidase